MAKITKELQETLKSSRHVEMVHFDAEGNHYFNVHKHPQTGEVYHRINTQVVSVNGAKPVKVVEPEDKNKIIESLTRNEVLSTVVEDESPEEIIKKKQEEIDALKAQIDSKKGKKSDA